MSDDLLVKLVVTFIVLTGFLVWQASERNHQSVYQNCATDLSARRAAPK
ncbi:hypothetical protein [Bradyrhizobium sp. LTSPM299]|nr:hypothetical protein [Bradyrhizobium sp. LTSPM299]